MIETEDIKRVLLELRPIFQCESDEEADEHLGKWCDDNNFSREALHDMSARGVATILEQVARGGSAVGQTRAAIEAMIFLGWELHKQYGSPSAEPKNPT